ncbi:MAG: (4S)-4-hydroxy-5-phosphonooxypentane-2,3-dione isomerase [Anaerolineales bacterium]
MVILVVSLHVKTEFIEAFKQASLENARQSLKEAGVVRFDVLQQNDDPSRFLFIEVYRTPEDPARHKETAHYHQWREVAEPMLAEERTRALYTNVFPADENW